MYCSQYFVNNDHALRNNQGEKQENLEAVAEPAGGVQPLVKGKCRISA